ncbi:unnamed protein product [Cylicocyclus nassatus]|uniref:Uncharacterized protein n=1 Tax=Cylicocyclus nassatus TaxID=53992 RepID=A0AA36H867_CYLNA|nr:unnamed protein product [Cylicocyclus nassatus]
MVNCSLCEKRIPQRSLLSRSSRSKLHNAIFVSTLNRFTSIPQELMETYFSKSLCVTHFIHSAQNLLAEVVVSGGKISRTLEDAAYITAVDIHDDIVDSLNLEIGSFATDVTIDKNDVCRYLNFYMKKYFGSNGWTVPHKDDQQQQPEHTQEEGSASLKSESTEEMELLEETDPFLLNEYFVVQGKKLLELFHITRCGCTSDSEAGVVRLTYEESMPVITYFTAGMFPEKRRWEGKEDT